MGGGHLFRWRPLRWRIRRYRATTQPCPVSAVLVATVIVVWRESCMLDVLPAEAGHAGGVNKTASDLTRAPLKRGSGGGLGCVHQ